MTLFISRLLLVLSVSINAFAFEFIDVKQGVNGVDLNIDGRMDYVLLAQYDNNKSHPNQSITFYIQKPEGGYSIMPSVVGNEFTYFALSLAGTNEMVNGFSLLNFNGHVYFATADKKARSPYDYQKFAYTLYKFMTSDDHPGAPLYSWIKVDKANSLNEYMSSDESFVELGLHFFKSEY
ncbi:MAG: hypothetical protein V7629_20060 [Motiliproteus sp.]